MGSKRRAGTGAIDLRLLGTFEASRGGRPVGVGGPKPKALLALLATEIGRVVTIDRLVEELWPGTPPETATHAVQVYVSQLRKALGDVIARDGPGYVLQLDPEGIDARRFERLAAEGHEELKGENAAAASHTLREALALWRGPALADFVYEPFAQSEIARLDELRTVVLEERVEADLALGRHAELVSELEALVQAQPLRERPRAQLMLALYRSGRQADALAAYRAARETLVGELGIDPGHELRSLEAAILRQDESLLLSDTTSASAMQFRRLATILFVDIAESMALGELLDAEAIGAVQRGYFETVAAALTRHGGTVEKYAGDTVMAAFGVPVSHEDDALRAARAAFDIQEGVAALNERLAMNHGITLRTRIGLAAGEVVATSTPVGQRFVAGDPVGIAARLQQEARPGEIVVGEVVARLIDHAAQLEPLGSLEIPGRQKPFSMFRLVETTPVAPAFDRRLDAPLVGRKRELAALRRSLKRAVDSGSCRVALVVAPPGVGKSRIAAELARRTRGVTALEGRCLSYGEGITYWPLREALAETESSEERDAVLAALEADTAPPAPEIALLFRRFCEAEARRRPLLLVFDDVHSAEPTFLELIEHLADGGEGPILALCLARDELLEERATFLEGRANTDLIRLDPLSTDETEALLDGLGGAILESDQRTRILEAAEGNPLFLEQLLALALEGGLGERTLPETIQALLAARLDRLGPGERAVLERGAVVGKEFSADDVVALLEPEAAPTADTHLHTLSARGFVRPQDGAFRFRHVLVQEAVYRSAPKRLRAELHERFADRLDAAYPDLPELDEFVGYHLEQAYQLRTELSESDRRTVRLAEDGGRRLGAAGIRALRRSDVPAARALLVRATSLIAPSEPLSRELRCDLAIAENASGHADTAVSVLERLVEDASSARDERVEAWARVELEYLLVRRDHHSADALLAATESAIPILERHGDLRNLGRALLFAGWAHGGHRSNHRAWLAAAERARTCYRQAGWPATTPLGELGCAIYWGPTPAHAGASRLQELLVEETSDPVGSAYLTTFLGGLVAQAGDIDRGVSLVVTARARLVDLGRIWSVGAYCDTVLGEIYLLAGDGEAAEATLRQLCRKLERSNDLSHLASRASDLGEALVIQERLDEAFEWTLTAERLAADDDINAQMMWPSIRARILARRGQTALALQLAARGVEIADGTDDLNRRAEAHRDLGEVFLLADRREDAEAAFRRAIELFDEKENTVGAARVRALDDDLALV